LIVAAQRGLSEQLAADKVAGVKVMTGTKLHGIC
jgi:hypothetical protein